MLNVIASGIVTGVLYAVVGHGLVVIYRTSKVLNFALGGMGVVVAYIAHDLLDHGLPYWLVLPLAICLGALLGGLVEILIARPLKRQPYLTVTLATLGALLVAEGAMDWIYGSQPTALPPVLANAGTLRLGDSFAMSANQLFIVAVGIVATAALVAIIQKTRLGLSMRATSSGPATSELLGVNVARVRLSAWMLGGAFGCLAAMLVTPLTYLAPTSFTTFLLTAFAAVVLGGFTSIGGLVIGAIAFGVGSNLLVIYLDAGLLATYTFVGVVLILVFRPHGIFGRAEQEVPEADLGRRARQSSKPRAGAEPTSSRPSEHGAPITEHRGRLVTGSGWLVLLVAFALVPFVMSGENIYLIATILATFIGVLGLNVVAGFSGQVSLGNSGFIAVGAYTAAYAADNGVSLPVALVLALLAGALVGLIIGLPATRLSGIYLVLVTLLFAFAMPELALEFDGITGGADGISFFSDSLVTPESQYWLVLAVAVGVVAVVLACASSRLGRSWRAVRDSEAGSRSLGLNPTTVKLSAFTLSSALVSLSGALSALLIGFVSPESFAVFVSVYALLAVVLGGAGSVFGSLIGAAFIVWVPQNTGDSVPTTLVFGLALIVVMVLAPTGAVPMLDRLATVVSRWFGALRTGAATVAPAPRASETLARSIHPETPAIVTHRLTTPPEELPTLATEGSDEVLLQLSSVNAGYGAGAVLRDMSLLVHKGEVVTLLGANGAGKSTVLRTISGQLRLQSGEVTWRGRAIGGRGLATPHQIVRQGLAHVPEGRGVFPDLTVDENLRMGLFGRSAAAQGSASDERAKVLELFPVLGDRLRQRAGTLSGGEQQMLAIGRAMIGKPRLLMLDEPSLGLAPVVSQQVFENLRAIANSGVSVLLIEQNARAALDLADRGYVIQRGQVVLQGISADLQRDEALSETYLSVTS